MKRAALLFLAAAFLIEASLQAAVHRFDCMYVGGSVPGLKEETAGLTHTADETVFHFDYKTGSLTIPYQQITSLEYGMNVGKHGVGTAAAFGAAFGAAGVAGVMVSKRRRHYLTVGFLDENQKPQVAVFEIGKDRIWATLYNLQNKTGKKLEYLDEESRKEVRRLQP
jgi:hypothetical protein